jgi:uncharacterized surface protein with fasciclin (FAS1) repeats
MKMNMFKFVKILSLPAMALGLLIFTGCGGDDEEEVPTMDIVELISSSKYQQASGAAAGQSLDSLVKYLSVYPDLVSLLSGTSEYTVFAPSNTAFISLLATPGFPEDIRDINPDIVKDVLAYHVVSGTVLAADLKAGSKVASLSSKKEEIEVNTDGTLLTGSTNKAIEVVSPDLKATNGVVHLVATVLISPSVGATLTPILGTNAGSLLLGAPFSTLAAGITLADIYAAANDLPTLVSILAGSTVHTVFAPTNATFEAGSITANTFTGAQWYGIIANHVVLGKTITPADLVTGATFDTAAGGKILVFNNKEAVPAKNGIGIYLDGNGSVDLTDLTTLTTLDAEVALPNAAENGNGVIHVIAGVLSPL